MNKYAYPNLNLTKVVIATDQPLKDRSEDFSQTRFYRLDLLNLYMAKGCGCNYDDEDEENNLMQIPKFLSRMLAQGTLSYCQWKHYPSYWMKSYKNQLLTEVSEEEKELVVCLAAEQGDVATIQDLHSLGEY